MRENKDRVLDKPIKISVNSALFLLTLKLHNANSHILYITWLIFHWFLAFLGFNGEISG